ncbi:hypothetical protein DFH29DRAFT_1009311 [Suillus ampliporus]|nr:hypothetical protein DFH29DRAFT_1009311 [Suillus ampliporus]
MPPSMIWDTNSEYPGVRVFAQPPRLLINVVRSPPFVKGDLVYLSTVNLSLPKGRARKLAPKFIGPFKILDDYKNNLFLLDLPSDLKQRGVLPGRQLHQITKIGKLEEWSVSCVTDHNGQGTSALFEVEYNTRDRVWLPYHEVSRLEATSQYLEALGVPGIQHLPKKISKVPANIPIATVNSFREACQQLSRVVNQMLNELPYQTSPISSNPSRLKAQDDWTYLHSHATPIPLMSAPIEHMMVDDLSYECESGEICPLPSPKPSGHHNRPRHNRGWRPNHAPQHHRREPDSDALNAFTCFFRTEAQAKELATRKEAHAFDQMLRAERERHYSHPKPSRHVPNLSLDNRGRHRSSLPRTVPATQWDTPSAPVPSAAQVISAAITSNSIAPPPPISSVPCSLDDQGPDVLEIISAMEQSDLENSSLPQSMTETELFGRLVTVGLLLTTVLTLFVAAFGSLEVRSSLHQ